MKFPLASSAITPPSPPALVSWPITSLAACSIGRFLYFISNRNFVGHDQPNEVLTLPGAAHRADLVLGVSAGADDRRIADAPVHLVRECRRSTCLPPGRPSGSTAIAPTVLHISGGPRRSRIRCIGAGVQLSARLIGLGFFLGLAPPDFLDLLPTLLGPEVGRINAFQPHFCRRTLPPRVRPTARAWIVPSRPARQ